MLSGFGPRATTPTHKTVLSVSCRHHPAALEAWSERIAGGILAGAGTSTGGLESEFKPRSKARWGADSQPDKGEARIRGVEGEGDEADPARRPNVVIMVLESTSGVFVTPSNYAGVSPWAKKLTQRSVPAERTARACQNQSVIQLVRYSDIQ